MKPKIQIVVLSSLVVFCWFALAAPPTLPVPDPAKVTEELSFEIKKFAVNQQGPQVIDVLVKARYVQGIKPKDYPDFEAVYKDLCGLMTKYPEKTDYWEIFNKNLCLELLKKYPAYASMGLDITVYPTYGIQYSHTSHCVVSR